MILNLGAVVRIPPLTGLMFGTCISLPTVALTGCGFPASRDVLAYDACAARHPQELAVCEGPRQAYELDPTAFQARADAASPRAGNSYAER